MEKEEKKKEREKKAEGDLVVCVCVTEREKLDGIELAERRKRRTGFIVSLSVQLSVCLFCLFVCMSVRVFQSDSRVCSGEKAS